MSIEESGMVSLRLRVKSLLDSIKIKRREIIENDQNYMRSRKLILKVFDAFYMNEVKMCGRRNKRNFEKLNQMEKDIKDIVSSVNSSGKKSIQDIEQLQEQLQETKVLSSSTKKNFQYQIKQFAQSFFQNHGIDPLNCSYLFKQDNSQDEDYDEQQVIPQKNLNGRKQSNNLKKKKNQVYKVQQEIDEQLKQIDQEEEDELEKVEEQKVVEAFQEEKKKEVFIEEKKEKLRENKKLRTYKNQKGHKKPILSDSSKQEYESYKIKNSGYISSVLMQIVRGTSKIIVFDMNIQRRDYITVKDKFLFPYKSACSQYKNTLLLSGGQMKRNQHPKVQVWKIEFQNQQCQKTDLIPLAIGKQEHCMVVRNLSQYFVLGGFDGKNALKQFEKFDGSKNSWKSMPPMNLQRYNFAACLNNKQKIYAFCGQINSKGEMTRQIEMYDLQKQQQQWLRMKINSVGEYELPHCAWISATPLGPHKILIYGHQLQGCNFVFEAREQDQEKCKNIESFVTKEAPWVSGYWCPGMQKKSENQTLYTMSFLEPYDVWRYTQVDQTWQRMPETKK